MDKRREAEFNQRENEWVIGLGENFNINGYYRHCASTCRAAKLLKCIGLPTGASWAWAFLAAMVQGEDLPPIDGNNERYDLLSDVFGIVASQSMCSSCEDTCVSYFETYQAIVESDLERRGLLEQ